MAVENDPPANQSKKFMFVLGVTSAIGELVGDGEERFTVVQLNGFSVVCGEGVFLIFEMAGEGVGVSDVFDIKQVHLESLGQKGFLQKP